MIAQTFCIAHKPIKIDLGEKSQVIWLGDAEIDRSKYYCKQVHVAELALHLDARHTFLSGSAGTFAIRYLIENNMDFYTGKSISIIQYRKIISKNPLGPFAKNYHGMVLIPSAEAILMDIDLIQSEINTPFLISQPGGLGNLYVHYANGHKIQDLLRYIAIAIDLEVITPEESAEIFESTWLFPGGIEFGVFPADFYINTIKKLEDICLEFLKHHTPASFDPYQRRALAFCNERLGSFLLKKHLSLGLSEGDSFPPEYFGYMHTIIDGDLYT
ncbi:MAG: hypothetical protein RLZZ612_1621 [Pseudomonadota bacterium]|jgi:hypothetical protein